MFSVFNGMIGQVLNSMLGYISLPDILQKIIQVSPLDLVLGTGLQFTIHLSTFSPLNDRILHTSSRTSNSLSWECWIHTTMKRYIVCIDIVCINSSFLLLAMLFVDVTQPPVCSKNNWLHWIFICWMKIFLQTLLKTTNHIMIHDVRGSLAHLRELVQRAVSPNVMLCVICTRRADCLADGSKDDVIVFRLVVFQCNTDRVFRE